MHSITKKRFKAYLIDLAVSTTVTLVTESLLEKKFKSDVYYNLVHPTLILWSLEYAQLKCGGQTLGYRQAGLKLESSNGANLSNNQIIKRMAYRDTVGGFIYLQNRAQFEGKDGSQFPYDHSAGVRVKEV
ncbi:RDD family protein [Oceanobacillus jeddahense]|uniref:RDD family protein n=1 Tax=Oceanobacillus jeddahense TaxID=1462527 RepID=A0ABY5JR96_9BACI|nr:RDD family protein [Oceanobacillus jeddahense]UUI02838.1 RDD family protein [Oceanobacillus jeddahense]